MHAMAIGVVGETSVHLEEMLTTAVVEKARIDATSIQLETNSAVLVLKDCGFGVLAVINVASVGGSVLVRCAEVTDLQRLLQAWWQTSSDSAYVECVFACSHFTVQDMAIWRCNADVQKYVNTR